MEDMKDIGEYLFRPGTLTIAVSVVILTFFTRKILELSWPVLKKRANETDPAPMYVTPVAMWWNEVILYAIPVLHGASFALVKSDFLHGDVVDLGGRLAFCAGTGWFSSFVYKGVRKLILQKTGFDIQPSSIPPPPDDSIPPQ